MTPITLPILVHNQKTTKLIDCGMDVDITMYDEIECTFYFIAATMPYNENGKNYCSVMVYGDRFIVPLSKETVDGIIQCSQY